MMCDFKPGDEVVCVYAGDVPSPVPGMERADGPNLMEGRIYTVVGVAFSHGEAGVVLREVKSLHPTGGYLASRFRKVQRRDLTAWLAAENTIEEPKRIRETESA